MDAENPEGETLMNTRSLHMSAAHRTIERSWIRYHVQNLFGHQVNPHFARNAELAFRGSFFLLICAIPVIIPENVSETRDKIIRYGIYNSSVCCFIVFNMGKTFGEAFDIAVSGIKGTIFAAAMGWLLFTICPQGYVEGHEVDFWIAVSISIVYVCAVMLLKLNLTLQMFAISNFADTLMTFLNTEVKAQVTPPWSGRWSLENDTLTQGLVCTGIGFITVMVATLLPYPLWSLMYVQENQLVMNRNISQVIQMMVDYYCEEDPNVYQKDAVLRHLRDLQSLTDDNEPLIRAAWWECFGMGRTHMKRQVLHAMDQTSNRVYYLAFNAWTVSDAKEAGSAKCLNAELMQRVKSRTALLLRTMEHLLNILVQAVEDGQLSTEEQQDVETLIDQLRHQERKLAEEFHKERRAVTGNSPKLMYEAVRVAQVLQWSISRIVGEIVQVADGVCKFSLDKSALPSPPESEGVLGIFSGFNDKDHLLYALRGISSYFLCFSIGYFGFGEFIPARESSIAATAPLLLSMYVGSALVNDLNRIQGLMLGNVLARLLGGFVDSCNTEDLILHSLITFTWTFGGLFVSFHSSSFSTIGLLAAAFGASTLLEVSCNHPGRIGKRDTFDGLTMNCVAVMITMVTDFLFHSDRASDLAFSKLNACWDEIFTSYKQLLDPQTTEVVFHCERARKLLREAESMSREAASEPRFWRTQWHHDLFSRACTKTEYLVIAMAALESVIAEHGRSGGKKFPTFVKLAATATNKRTYCMFGDEKSVIVLLKFAAVKKLLKIFVHETVQKFEGFLDRDSTHQFASELKAVESEFMSETVPLFFGLEDDEPEESMSRDEMAHLSVVFAGFHRTTTLLRSVQHMILASRWE